VTIRRSFHELFSLLITGIVARSAQPSRDLAKLPGKDACFWTRNLEGWTVLNDSTLIVHAPPSQDAYLIKLFAPIQGLQFHEQLGFEGGDGDPGQICRDNAYVIAGGSVPQREPVVAMRTLSRAEAAQLIRANGAPAPHRPVSAGQMTPTG
jgi:Family of unknown function (DUF6491)